MTIAKTDNRNQYTGDGTTTAFAFQYRFFADSDLGVYVLASGVETKKTLTTHYTVSNTGTESGGTVTFGTAPASGVTVTIIGEIPYTQTADYADNDAFPAATHETALDRSVRLSQRITEVLDRAITVPASDTAALVLPLDRVGKVVSFDASNNVTADQELGTHRGNWAASTAYLVRDIVTDASNNNVYICLTAHTSSGSTPISGNADAAKWRLVIDAAAVASSASAAAASASAAATSETNAATSATNAATSATNAATSETNAATSETNAAASEAAAATSEANAAASAAAAALYDGLWLDDVAALLADTSLTYTAAQPGTVAAGDYVQTRAEGFSYEVAASGATDHHLTTAGGVKLYVQAGPHGYNVKAFGAVGDGVTDDTAAIQAAIGAAGIGGTILFGGVHAISATLTPLAQQTWIGNGSAGSDLFFTSTSSDSGVEFTSASNYAKVQNIGFRATAGFTGAAFKFNGSFSATLERSLIRNILNGRGVEFSGGTFYNEARNIKVTSCAVGLYVTGLSPACPNNNIVDNFDVYGAADVKKAMFSDSNCSMFTLRNFISEADCTEAVLHLTAGSFEFISPRLECTITPSQDFFDISGAGVLFDGQQYKIQKATNPAYLTSDLSNFRDRKINNVIPDPFFVRDLAAGGTTAPDGWTVYTGTVSSFARVSPPPGVIPWGNSLEMVTGSASAGLRYSVSGSAANALFRGGVARVHIMSWFSAPGTNFTAVIRQEGGAGGATSTVSENTTAGQWAVHSVDLVIPSDATTFTIQAFMVGSGGTFRMFSPVLEAGGAIYAMSPTGAGYEIPYFYNGFRAGDLGLYTNYASAAPVSGTYRRGDRIFNRFPLIGQPKSWVCTVGGTPGTWVSEGNL